MDSTSAIKIFTDMQLVSMIKSKGNEKKVAKGATIFDSVLDSGLCYIAKGSVDVLRKNDKLLVGNVNGSMVLGLATLFYPIGYLLKAKTDCTCIIMDKVEALQEIEKLNLWQEVAELLAYQISRHANRDKSMIGKNAYDIVKHYIEELATLPAESRNHIKIATYLLERSGLSKSRVYSILQQLIEGRYLNISNGRLVSVNRLPNKF